MNRCASVSLLIVLLASASLPCFPEAERSDFVLGTTCIIKLAKGGSDRTLDASFARLQELEAELTVNKDGSQIDAVNAAAGKHPVKIGIDAMNIIKRGLEYSQASDGAFDQTVGPLVKLWNITSSKPSVPSDAARKAALNLINWKDVIINDADRSVYLKRPGMGLDLGSASKGYAADEVAKILRSQGVTSAIIDLGGNVLTVGSKPDGTPWRIGLQNPDADRGSYLGILRIVDRTVVTSGVYERFFIQDGKRYHHILDTRTGFPVDNGLTSVTIITPKSFDADGLTTAIFALGRDKGMALAKKRGVDVIIIDDQHRIWMDPAVSGYFRLTDKAFTIQQ
jgi:FAD:protein FMN transferase